MHYRLETLLPNKRKILSVAVLTLLLVTVLVCVSSAQQLYTYDTTCYFYNNELGASGALRQDGHQTPQKPVTDDNSPDAIQPRQFPPFQANLNTQRTRFRGSVSTNLECLSFVANGDVTSKEMQRSSFLRRDENLAFSPTTYVKTTHKRE
ncbi:hypothetical protein LJC40_00530 [Synergistaceae bacterium OttesenSCG-928-D05]|nr:hypothetical protein [Synergistaceae bacterium OttesenSCG-928-D05]